MGMVYRKHTSYTTSEVPDFPAASVETGITSGDNVKNEIISTGQQVDESEFHLSLN